MRTKTLLLTAALGFAGLSASMAQVYSVNIVGYVNVPVTAGQFKFLANPLSTTSNTLGGVLTPAAGVGDGDNYYHWTGTTFEIETYLGFLGGWLKPDLSSAAAIPFAPGGGGFYVGGGTNLTLVGEVLTGGLTNTLVSGLTLVSSKVPQGGDPTTLGLEDDLVDGANLLKWNPAGNNYIIYTKLTFLPGGWDPSVPNIGVAEAFFLGTTGGSWNRTFNP